MTQASPSPATPFGTWLRQRRKALDLTQESLAAAIDVSLPTIVKIEAGQRRPSRLVAELLARCLQVPPEEQAAFMRLARAPLQPGSEPTAALPHLPAVDLPAPLDRLIGREHELEQLAALLGAEDVRLLTLTGPGGVGKTRLAIALAWRLADRFPDGVHFIPLSVLRDPGLVLDAIARRLGVTEASDPLADSLCRRLAGRRLLLLLDSCEHLLAAAPEVSDLLSRCPSLRILATSREGLRVRGERQFHVLPLPLPDLAHLPPLAVVAALPPIALFVERACDVAPDLVLDEAGVATVAAICTRLDGLPLAIELAAAHMDLLTPAALLASLESRLAVDADLAAAARDLPPRQRSLHDTIGWSYDLLSPGEQVLFCRLGVFAGGFTLSAAEAVCNSRGDLPLGMPAGLAALLRKSLLVAAPSRPGRQTGPIPDVERRLAMLETIREYALERLAASGSEREISRCHLEYYLALAEAASPEVLAGPEQAAWVRRLEDEHDNIRAALAWSVAGGADTAELALRLSSALGRFWDMRGYVREGRRWLQLALQNAAARQDEAESSRPGAISPRLRAKALTAAGNLAMNQGDYPAARTSLQQALGLAEETGDRRRMSLCLMNLGTLANRMGEYDEGRALLERALALMRELDDRAGVARALLNLGIGAAWQGQYERARALCEESLALRRQLKDEYGIALLLGNLGDIAARQGDYARAHALLAESLAMREEAGDERGIAFCLAALADLANREGSYSEARSSYGRSLTMHQELGDQASLAAGLEGLGLVYLNLDRPALAVRLWSAAQRLRSAGGSAISLADRPRYETAVALARSRLGEAAFGRTWAEGAALPLADAIGYALDSPPAGAAPR